MPILQSPRLRASVYRAHPCDEARDFVRQHAKGLETLLTPSLGPVAEDLVRDLAAAVRSRDAENAANALAEVRDKLDSMIGDPSVAAPSPHFDSALAWYVARLHDLANKCLGG
jgi:hypothetical protein